MSPRKEAFNGVGRQYGGGKKVYGQDTSDQNPRLQFSSRPAFRCASGARPLHQNDVAKCSSTHRFCTDYVEHDAHSASSLQNDVQVTADG